MFSVCRVRDDDKMQSINATPTVHEPPLFLWQLAPPLVAPSQEWQLDAGRHEPMEPCLARVRNMRVGPVP